MPDHKIRPGDPLGDALSALMVAASGIVFFEFRSPWAIRIDYEHPISCMVMEGELWLKAPGKEPEHYGEGDTFLLPRGPGMGRYFLSSSRMPSTEWITTDQLRWESGLDNSTPRRDFDQPVHVSWGGEGPERTKLISFAFSWRDRRHGPLISALPELMRVDAADSGATLLDTLVRFPLSEGYPNFPGYGALIAQTAQLFLVHAVRTFVITYGKNDVGWLQGIADPKISRALAAVYREPEQRWTVGRLAEVAGMSRTVFAEQFHETVGESPMRYVCSWRMHLARVALESGKVSITALANELGYQSEAAFRSAFRKETGLSPREYLKSLEKETS